MTRLHHMRIERQRSGEGGCPHYGTPDGRRSEVLGRGRSGRAAAATRTEGPQVMTASPLVTHAMLVVDRLHPFANRVGDEASPRRYSWLRDPALRQTPGC